MNRHYSHNDKKHHISFSGSEVCVTGSSLESPLISKKQQSRDHTRHLGSRMLRSSEVLRFELQQNSLEDWFKLRSLGPLGVPDLGDLGRCPRCAWLTSHVPPRRCSGNHTLRCKQTYLTYFVRFHIEVIQYLSLSDIYIYIYMYIYLKSNILQQLSVDEHLGCFHILTIVTSAAMNIGLHISFQIRVFLSRYILYTQELDCWILQQLYLQSFKEPPYCFPQ